MKVLKKTLALTLCLLLTLGTFVFAAAALEGEKQYYDYDKVLLLGDSEASGFTDYGDEFSEFNRVDDSYAAYIADYFGAEYYPMACPGFRTLELRCMLDDNYYPSEDPYLFKKVPRTPEDEIMKKAPALRQAIKDSDLIIIGIGGNDWGAYMGWVQEDCLAANILPEDYRLALQDMLKNAKVGDDIIGMAIQLADYLNAVDELMVALPEAMKYGFSNLRENWEYIIEYIYENNPDVTIAAIGMFPTYLKTEEGAPDVVAEPDPVSAMVEDMIIALGNQHMIEGQEKYGYIYVDTAGTVVEICHPTVAGHRYIADKILAALPDARFPYSDVALNSAEYKAIEYMYQNDLMKGETATTFGGGKMITEAEVSEVLNKISGTYEITDSEKEVNALKLGFDLMSMAKDKDFLSVVKDVFNLLKLVLTGKAFGNLTRAEAALQIYKAVA